ncbi:HepT-like ribonuclease domain-containing protein [Hymenobacter weizhouensis]|uniref:HepT-like ribonuclease domain-containing protein n=1 Tax=Hymenobacter sp. YIM 151500-1 TaxID=2987689 RepID=UPI0022266484|nr:DUF86 domain-containing protein [Hymenobacter sp. YIM 151500-1]UYZ64539.1 DUF86 domain-containing protein [Hymenobacter sp. YIM 151500-1]
MTSTYSYQVRVEPHAWQQQMVDFRNRLIHSYDNIDDVIVWAILKRHLPVLKADVQRQLQEPE